MKQDKREEMLAPGPEYEYCPNCYANLLLQKGFRNDLPYWICKGWANTTSSCENTSKRFPCQYGAIRSAIHTTGIIPARE